MEEEKTKADFFILYTDFTCEQCCLKSTIGKKYEAASDTFFSSFFNETVHLSNIICLTKELLSDHL